VRRRFRLRHQKLREFYRRIRGAHLSTAGPRHWRLTEELAADRRGACILTNATIYWANEAIGTSIRAYRNANLYPWTPSHDRQPPIEAPAGFTFLLGDASPPSAHAPEQRIAAFKAGGGRFYADVRNVNVREKGGHFGPWEKSRGVDR
jgi:hypothetical protein